MKRSMNVSASKCTSKIASFSMTSFVNENLKLLYYVVCIFRAQGTRIEHSRVENGFGRRVEFAISGRRRTNLNIIIRARRTAMNHSDRSAIDLFFIFLYGRWRNRINYEFMVCFEPEIMTLYLVTCGLIYFWLKISWNFMVFSFKTPFYHDFFDCISKLFQFRSKFLTSKNKISWNFWFKFSNIYTGVSTECDLGVGLLNFLE